MTVTIDPPTDLGDGVFRVTWSTDQGDGTVFYVYLGGLFAFETQLTEWTFQTPAGGETAALHIEILDEEPGYDPEVLPGRALLCWYGVDDVDYYTVEEYVDSSWTERQRIIDRGEGYFRWRSRILEDVTTHQFRVTATGDNGNDSTALSLTIFMVRVPDKPRVTYAYDDGTRKVTISAA